MRIISATIVYLLFSFTFVSASVFYESISSDSGNSFKNNPFQVKILKHEIKYLPALELYDLLVLKAPFVNDPIGGFLFQGGYPGETAYSIDGMPLIDVYSNELGIPIDISIIDELQINYGSMRPDLDNALSGQVNIKMKEGGSQYRFNLITYGGDYQSSADVFSVVNRVTPGETKSSGYVTENVEKENPLERFNPVYNLNLNFSGPVLPALKDKLRFFVSGRFLSNEGYLYGREFFLPQSLPGDSSLVALNPYKEQSIAGNIAWQINPQMKLKYTLLWNKNKHERTYERLYKYVPGGTPQQNENSNVQMLNWQHNVTNKLSYNLRIGHFRKEFSKYVYENPTKMPHWLARSTEAPDGEIIDLATPEGQAQLENWKENDISFEYFIDPENREGYVEPDFANPPALYSFCSGGNDLNHLTRSTEYRTGKLNGTYSFTPEHQISGGLEWRNYKLEMDDFRIITQKDSEKGEEIIPWTPSVPLVSSCLRDKYTKKPSAFTAWLQDNFVWKIFTLELGLRYDYFNSNGIVPANDKDFDIYHPLSFEFIYKDWKEPDNSLTVAELEEYISTLQVYTPAERKTFMYKDVAAKSKLSPRIHTQIAITKNLLSFIDFNKNYQMPALNYFYYNSDFNILSEYTLLGNSNLDFQEEQNLYFGFRTKLGKQVLGVSYYKKSRNYIVDESRYLRTYSTSFYSSKYINLNNSVDYNGYIIEFAGCGWNYFDYSFNYSILNKEKPRDNFYKHLINGCFRFHYNDWYLSLTGNYFSSQRYFTVSDITGEKIVMTLPVHILDLYQLNLHLSKEFHFNPVTISCFMRIFNITNKLGEPSNEASIKEDLNNGFPGYNANRVSAVDDYTNFTDNYAIPRQILFGISVGIE